MVDTSLTVNSALVSQNPADLEKNISKIKGVIEVGLFIGICDAVVLSSSSGVEILVNPNGRLN